MVVALSRMKISPETKRGHYGIINGNLYLIKAVEDIIQYFKTDSTWVTDMTAGNESEPGTISDFFESGENILYYLALAPDADRLMEMRLWQPKATQLGGIKEQADVPITQDESPKDNPQVYLYMWDKEKEPSFKLKNPGNYDMVYARIYYGGFGSKKMLLDKVSSVEEYKQKHKNSLPKIVFNITFGRIDTGGEG